MKMEIKGEAFAIAEVDLYKFKDQLGKDWHIENAIKDNTIIKENKHPKELSANHLKSLVWTSMDWGGLFDFLKMQHDKHMKIKFYIVEYSDWKKFYPDKVKDSREWTFQEVNEKGTAVILIQSLFPNPNFDLKAFIKHEQFEYASTKDRIVGWVDEKRKV